MYFVQCLVNHGYSVFFGHSVGDSAHLLLEQGLEGCPDVLYRVQRAGVRWQVQDSEIMLLHEGLSGR